MATEIQGRVACVNGNGFKLDSQDGWLNLSKFAKVSELPARGADVAVTLDGAGFVRVWSAMEATPAPSPASPTSAAGTEPSRDRVICREWAMNAAITMMSAGGLEVDPVDARKLAEQLESWALRPAS